MEKFYSNGKLLLTGEYVVLDGALSLAIPTKFGQSLVVTPINEPVLKWKSLDDKNSIWFEAVFRISKNDIDQINKNVNSISDRLLQILNATKQLNPDFLSGTNGFEVTTQLDFPKNWGLGTSSTLINNIAEWANVDAFKLLKLTFGGSGYDIACAQNNTPITYQVSKNNRKVNPVEFNPPFKQYLYFVYLNKKQNSREGISHYKANNSLPSSSIESINTITRDIITCTTLNQFEILINTHEQLISKTINQKPIKEVLFDDFKGCIKSLGAWGGDFVLITSTNNPLAYFNDKGYNIIIPYTDMIL